MPSTISRVCLSLLLGFATHSIAAELEPLPNTTATGTSRTVHSQGQVQSGDPVVFTALGDTLFRRGDFDGAAEAYTSAAKGDPELARAYWGLSRVEYARCNRKVARDLAAKAFRLNPRDPDIVAHYAEFVADPQVRAVLFANVLELTRNTDPERARDSAARALVQRRLAAIASSEPGQRRTRHSLTLDMFRPHGSQPAGMLVTARINGGKPVRLLLDTGARDLIIDPRAARELDLEAVSESAISGIAGTGGQGRIAIAGTVAFGDLVLRNRIVQVSDRKITDGADGVVGLNVFEGYRIRLDPTRRTIDLLPIEEQPDSSISTGTSRVPLFRLRHLLFVKARFDGGEEGLFLLDTGAAFTAVRPELTRSHTTLGSVALNGPCGTKTEATRLPTARVLLGETSVTDPSPLMLDLGRFGRNEGVDISGVLGFSTLRQLAFTVDYENGLLEFEAPADHR